MLRPSLQVWIYAVILTEAGAYNNASPARQEHCRTDQSSVLQNSPWGRSACCTYEALHVFALIIETLSVPAAYDIHCLAANVD